MPRQQQQQLLAHALETTGAEGASRVRVVHVAPPGNSAYQRSLVRVEHGALGETVGAVWQQLLSRPERLASLDSGLSLDAEITSLEYRLRYADHVVHNMFEPLAGLGPDLESSGSGPQCDVSARGGAECDGSA